MLRIHGCVAARAPRQFYLTSTLALQVQVQVQVFARWPLSQQLTDLRKKKAWFSAVQSKLMTTVHEQQLQEQPIRSRSELDGSGKRQTTTG